MFLSILLICFTIKHRPSTPVPRGYGLKSQMKKVYKSRNDITAKLFSDGITKQKSIVVTVEGSEPGTVIIGAHLDSISEANMELMDLNTEKLAPGGDDDGSGLMVLMEALRVIVETGYKPKKTVEIHAYGAEEIGLRGPLKI